MKSLWLVWFLCLASVCFAQNDTLFWFAAPDVTQIHEDRPVFFRVVTTDKPSNLTISVPAQGLVLVDTLVAPNQVFSHRIVNPDFLEVFDGALNINKGIKITSDVPVSVYYEVEAQGFNTDIYALKGRFALGTTFKVPLQKEFPNRPFFVARNSVQIVATEDATSVTFTPSVVGLVPVTISLNEGQTFVFVSDDEEFNTRLSGSTITSTKPIAVSLTDDSVEDGINFDLIGDQLIPMEFAGNLYALPVGLITFSSLTETSISVGSQTVSLNASNNFTESIFVDEPVLAESVVPFVVNFVDRVFNTSGSEFGGAILPPLACSGSSEVAFTRNNVSQRFFLYLLFRTSSINDFTLDESPFLIDTSLVFQLDTNLSYIKIETFDALSRGNHRIKNEAAPFHLAIGGGSVRTGYQLGYFSNFRTEIEDTIPLCDLVSTPQELLSEINLFGQVTLDTLIEKVDSTFLKITVVDEYCVTEDSAWVLQLEAPILNLPDSILLCGTTDSILSLDAERVIFNVQETDTFRVRGEEISVYIENKQGCSATKVIKVESISALDFNFLGDSVFCAGDTGTLIVANNNADSLFFNGILTTNDTLTVSNDTLVVVNLRNACFETDTSWSARRIELPVVELGEDREVCSFFNEIILPETYAYLWHDGSRDTIYQVYESGLHTVTSFTEEGCFVIDSVTILYKAIDSLNPIPDALLCPEEKYSIFIEPIYDSYEWNDGLDTNRRLLGAGSYEVDVLSTVNDTLCYRENYAFNVDEFQLSVPNVITPNDDGLNDDFVTLGIEGTDNVEFSVVNRWGKTIHTTDSFNGTWTPSTEITPGVYYFKTTSLVHECLNLKGWITVLK